VLKLLEEVESELKDANVLAHLLHTKAESLEVKYKEEACAQRTPAGEHAA